MSATWVGGPPPEHPPFTASDKLRIALRIVPMGLTLGIGLALLGLLRLVEKPLYRMDRPWTPWITVMVCRLVLRIMGLRVIANGPRMSGPGAYVANHTSWLDIFVLNSRKPLYFVSKAEVAAWPGIGLLARATGTVFISRERRLAAEQTKLFQERLKHGHRLLFFPEGTSTDGLQVLPFKTTLFAAFYAEALRETLQMQAISVTYVAPEGQDQRFYGWWGDMDFAPSLLRLLAQPRQGHVEITYHAPLHVKHVPDRKTLARRLEMMTRAGHGPGAGACRQVSSDE
jgi:1-acyl-sn-glycerol-3-phosphate acyltransferase